MILHYQLTIMTHQQLTKVTLVEAQQVQLHLVTDVGLVGITTLLGKLQHVSEIDLLISLRTQLVVCLGVLIKTLEALTQVLQNLTLAT